MTTPPATADGQVPGWLPDEATLSRLAGEFFRAVPGQPPHRSGPATPDLPAAQPPPGTPTTVVSGPSGPPSTSAPTAWAGGATRSGGPTPRLPGPPVIPQLPGFGHSQLPGFGHSPLPSLAAPASAPRSGSPFYFLDQPEPVPVVTASTPLTPGPAFDVHAVRRDFPILAERVNGRPLVWLDNAATTQKPRAVLDRLVEFYSRENSNIHRAAHELAARATDAYEHARAAVARFLGAGSAEEIVFVRGTTEAINLIAKAWGPANVGAGDEILVSHLEHHANIVPWQTLAEQTGARIKVIPVDDDGQLLLDEYARLLSPRTKLVAVTQVSNALGTVVPVEALVAAAHDVGARVLVDAAQSAPHLPIDVRALDVDFLAFSGHKVFGPTGIGALYGRREVLADMPPWEGGGNMITDVTFEGSRFQDPPGRFEAGTGSIADAVGLAAALEYVERIGLPNIAAYEHALLEYATHRLSGIPGLRLIGTAPVKASVVSFVLDGHDPVEVGKALNEDGIAVRAGHHCAQPILRRFGLEATVRPSLAFYNTFEEVDALAEAVHRIAGGRTRRLR